eukprot:1159742-Pelagomonas_calceolata.AAC.3
MRFIRLAEQDGFRNCTGVAKTAGRAHMIIMYNDGHKNARVAEKCHEARQLQTCQLPGWWECNWPFKEQLKRVWSGRQIIKHFRSKKGINNQTVLNPCIAHITPGGSLRKGNVVDHGGVDSFSL